jgi:excinuclease ABC subunit C
MKDASGSVIYVGKAVNLRQRLRSYFSANPQGNAKVQAMVARIDDFATIICAHELEALVLESTLIKKHMPPYNILLRDDRDYPYIRITMNEMYPRVMKAFRIAADRSQGARYFGPYLAGDVAQALDALRAIFPLKTCRRVLPRDIGKERPCLNYYIGRCIGPCKGDVPAEAYRQVMTRICRFFEGQTDGILADLQADMTAAADRLAFEEAARIRDRIQALEKLMKKQTVVDSRPVDRDVIGYCGNGSEICLQKLEIRQGRLVASAAFFWPDSELDLSDVVRAFVVQHYPDTAWIPPEILLPASPADLPAVTDFLRTLRQGRCLLRVPQRGQGAALLQMAQANAAESLRRHTLQGGSRQTALQETLKILSDLLELPQPPRRIEALDISHQGAQDIAAGLVVFEEGRPVRRQYRHFRLDQMTGPDDYEAMRQTLRRRLGRLNDPAFGVQPDLILADGGIGQVRTLCSVLDEYQLAIPVAGMVKDDRHRTRGLVTAAGRVIELRPAPAGNPLLLADKGPGETGAELDAGEQLALLRLLTAIQDEAHRFAGRYQSRLHQKRQTRFSLEAISGVGPARRRLLLQHFDSIKKISQAALPDLEAVKGLGSAAAAAVYKHFHPEEEA